MSKLNLTADKQEQFVAARCALLDATEALASQLKALILVGAQAVYLRSGDADIPVAIYTADADIGIDRGLLEGDPRLQDAMRSAGFDLHPDPARRQPGTWYKIIHIGSKHLTIPIDLLVPSQFSGTTASRRSARIPPHDKMAARKVEGIELATIDNDILLVESLDREDRRSVRMKVAGPVALLVAKAYKIRDRATDPTPGREAFKDAADVIRLMRTSDVAAASESFSTLLAHGDPRIASTAETGLDLLKTQFGRTRAAGIAMAKDALAGALPPESVEALAVAFIRNLAP